MQHTLDDLLTRNAFAVLRIPPSTPAAEIRRAVEQARMESEMGLLETTVESVDAAQQALSREPGLFEMRVFAPWAGDAHLASWVDAHDILIATLRAVSGEPAPVNALPVAIDRWLLFARLPGAMEALGALAPESLDAPGFWGEVLAEIAKAGTVRAGRRAEVALLRRTLADGWSDPGPLCRVVTDSVLSGLDGVAQEARSRAAADGAVDPAAAASLDAQLGRAQTEAKGLLEALLTEPGLRLPGASDGVERVLTKSKLAADVVSTVFHNAGEYARAEKAILDVLALPYSPADREDLAEQLRIVRLVAARIAAHTAVERRDYRAAGFALQRVIETTHQPEERASAGAVLANVRQAEQAAAAPAPVRWLRRAGWRLVVTGTFVSIVAVLAIIGAVAGDDDDGGDATVAPSVQTRVAAALTPFRTPFVPAPFRSPVASPPALGTVPPVRASTAVPTPSAVPLVAGDCIAWPGAAATPTGTPGTGFIAVRKVPCSEPGSATVLAVGQLTGSVFPSTEEVQRQIAEICPAETTNYVSPSAQTWAAGQRRVLCLKV